MTTTTQVAELAATFERLNNDMIGLVSGCTDDQWKMSTKAESWTVAATAHHIAIVQQAFVGMVERLADGETVATTISLDELHEANARHACEFAEADRAETLEILQSSGDDMAALIGNFEDAGLDRVAGTFGDNELIVGQVFENVVIGHARVHQESIRKTFAG